MLLTAILNCSYVIHITMFHDTRRQNEGVKLQHVIYPYIHSSVCCGNEIEDVLINWTCNFMFNISFAENSWEVMY
jgi:hypothetical protein